MCFYPDRGLDFRPTFSKNVIFWPAIFHLSRSPRTLLWVPLLGLLPNYSRACFPPPIVSRPLRLTVWTHFFPLCANFFFPRFCVSPFLADFTKLISSSPSFVRFFIQRRSSQASIVSTNKSFALTTLTEEFTCRTILFLPRTIPYRTKVSHPLQRMAKFYSFLLFCCSLSISRSFCLYHL